MSENKAEAIVNRIRERLNARDPDQTAAIPVAPADLAVLCDANDALWVLVQQLTTRCGEMQKELEFADARNEDE